MAEAKIFAVVTGANKGIGFGVVRQLASQGITVVLTARDEKRGLEAVHKLKEELGSSLSGDVVLFHQLDVADSSSVASLAEFVKAQFGRLEILVNNAGIGGAKADGEVLRASEGAAGGTIANIDWNKITTETHELAVECLQTNYYGARRMIEAFIPLLQLSPSPRIVNVSSESGKLQNIPSEWAKGMLSGAGRLTEERVDEVVNEFLKDFKEGSLEAKGWPKFLSAYTVSKVVLNAYTRIVAKKQQNNKKFQVNCVSPGFVKTDLNFHRGILTVDEGAHRIVRPVRVALLPDDGPTGLFFISGEESPF